MRKRNVKPAMLIALTLASSSLWAAPAGIARAVIRRPLERFDRDRRRHLRPRLSLCARHRQWPGPYDDPSFDVSGHVDARGHVSVSVSAGGQRANGTGSCPAITVAACGADTRSTLGCSGHWEAERRG